MAGLTRESASRILRRAAELDQPAPHDEHGPSPELLRAAAAEVGISGAAMDRAIAEERLRTILGLDVRNGGRLSGPDRLVVVAEGRVDALARLDLALRSKARFRRIPSAGPTLRYERRTDVVARVRRVSRFVRGADRLERPPQVTVASALYGERMLVGAVAEMRGERLAVAGAAGAVGVGGTATAAVLGLAVTPWFVLVAPCALALGAGLALARRAATGAAQRELEAFVLDALAPDSPQLQQTSGAVRHRLARQSPLLR